MVYAFGVGLSTLSAEYVIFCGYDRAGKYDWIAKYDFPFRL